MRRPLRLRSPEKLLEGAKAIYGSTGYDEISLCSLSTSDYPELGSEEYNPEHRYREKELESRFREKLASLPEEARAVFILKELEGLSYEEIASRLKIKRGTVSSRLFYARRRLKEALGVAEKKEKAAS